MLLGMLTPAIIEAAAARHLNMVRRDHSLIIGGGGVAPNVNLTYNTPTKTYSAEWGGETATGKRAAVLPLVVRALTAMNPSEEA